MLNKGLILGFVLIGIAPFAKAQEGHVKVSRDTLIAVLQAFRADNSINPTAAKTVALENKVVERKNARRVKVRGFRVQIFSGSSRNEAYAVQSRFLNAHADDGSYISYDEHNYRVKVGDFRSRAEATNLMRVLKSQYRNVFVFTEDVWGYE